MDQLLSNVPLLMLVASRMLGLTMTHPIFPAKMVPAQVRVALAILVGLIVFPTVEFHQEMADGSQLIAATFLEFLVGMILGFIGMMVFAAVQMAGGILDLDLGFSMAQVYDPSQGAAVSLLATLFNYLALTLFFAFNGHHWVIEGLVHSYQVIPVGGLTLNAKAPFEAVMLFGQYMGIAVKLAFPVIAALMMASVALAVVNRAVPQIQLFSYAMAIKALLGIVVLIVVLPYIMTGAESLFDTGNQHMLQLMELFR